MANIQDLKANFLQQFQTAAKRLSEIETESKQLEVQINQLKGALFALDQAQAQLDGEAAKSTEPEKAGTESSGA